MTHDYHQGLAGFDERQLLVDGCRECEQRSHDYRMAVGFLDTDRLLAAWQRALDWRGGVGDLNLSEAEMPLLSFFETMSVTIERMSDGLVERFRASLSLMQPPERER